MNPVQTPTTVEDPSAWKALERIADEQREVDRLKALGAVELDANTGRPEEPQTFADVGIVNRRSARAAGLRNPSRSRSMSVPKASKRKRRRR